MDGFEVTAAVLVLEAWMKTARPGETLDMTEPPSEAFDRREVVVLTGKMVEHTNHRQAQNCPALTVVSEQEG